MIWRRVEKEKYIVPVKKAASHRFIFLAGDKIEW